MHHSELELRSKQDMACLGVAASADSVTVTSGLPRESRCIACCFLVCGTHHISVPYIVGHVRQSMPYGHSVMRLACKQEEPTVGCNLACHVLTAMLCRYEDADAGDCITSHFRGTTNAASITTAASTAQEQQQQQPAGVSVSAQLLVAADGYFSRVRRQCLGDGPPEVRGSIVPLVCINTYFCTTALAPPA